MDKSNVTRNVYCNNCLFKILYLIIFFKALNVVTNQPNRKNSKSTGKILYLNI